MTTWRDLVNFVHDSYEVISEEPGEVRILFSFGDGDEEEGHRDQVIVLVREVLDQKHEWVQMASPLGLASRVDLRGLLEEIGNSTIACGAAIIDDHVILRHSLPIADLDLPEFVEPLSLLAGTADHLEELFFGGDAY